MHSHNALCYFSILGLPSLIVIPLTIICNKQLNMPPPLPHLIHSTTQLIKALISPQLLSAFQTRPDPIRLPSRTITPQPILFTPPLLPSSFLPHCPCSIHHSFHIALTTLHSFHTTFTPSILHSSFLPHCPYSIHHSFHTFLTPFIIPSTSPFLHSSFLPHCPYFIHHSSHTFLTPFIIPSTSPLLHSSFLPHLPYSINHSSHTFLPTFIIPSSLPLLH